MGITQCIPPGTQVMVKRVDIVNRSVLGDRTRNINIRVGDQLPGYKYKKKQVHDKYKYKLLPAPRTSTTVLETNFKATKNY